MKIEALKSYQKRRPKGCYFQDLAAWQRDSAWKWLDFFVARHRQRTGGQPLESWRRALFVGLATRLARHPPDRQWGCRMLACRGSRAAQRKHWPPGQHPLEAYNRRYRLMKAAQEQPEKAVGGSTLPGQEVTFPKDTISLHVRTHGRTLAELTKQTAEQMIQRLSSDDRFRINAGLQLSHWDVQMFLTPIS